jgi:hypothetical protein
MNIDKLVNEVIPPSDYQHRNGFNNIPIINKLTKKEKQLLENALIEKLLLELDNKIPDTLIVETLAYLKSRASLSMLKKILENCGDVMIKLKVATSIFEIDQDVKMVDVALNSVNQMDNKKDAYYIYKLSSAFYYLAKFKNERTKQFIEEYTSHPEYLIAYNAKQALSME